MRWIVFSVLGALMPLMVTALVLFLAGKSAPSGTYTPGLLFFATMLCARGVGDGFEANDKLMAGGNHRKVPFWLVATILANVVGVVVSAILYGASLFNDKVGPANTTFQANVGVTSAVLACLVAMFAGLVQTYYGLLDGPTLGEFRPLARLPENPKQLAELAGDVGSPAVTPKTAEGAST